MMETLLQSLILDVARIALVNLFSLSALVFIFDYLGEKAGGWLAPSRERRRSGEKGEKTGDVIER
jgi:hypothetical protein